MPNDIYVKGEKFGGVVDEARKVTIENNAKIRRNGILVTNVEDALDCLSNPDVLTKEQYEAMDEDEKSRKSVFWDDGEDFMYMAQDIGLDASLGLGESVHEGFAELNNNLAKCAIVGEKITLSVGIKTTGWYDTPITLPTMDGCTLSGFLLETNTYRIYSVTYSGGTIHYYVGAGSGDDSKKYIYCTPLFVKN